MGVYIDQIGGDLQRLFQVRANGVLDEADERFSFGGGCVRQGRVAERFNLG